MVTNEGINIDVNIKSLAEGEGFVVKVETEWETTENNRTAVQEAVKQGILGRKLNGHEGTPSDALNRVTSSITNFWSELGTFIDNWNTENT